MGPVSKIMRLCILNENSEHDFSLMHATNIH